MDEAYRDAMREHIATLEEELTELTELLTDSAAFPGCISAPRSAACSC